LPVRSAGGWYDPGVSTPAGPKPTPDAARLAFVVDVWRALSEVSARAVAPLGDAAREVAIAQAALESGWGTSRPYRLAWNAWNVAKGSWTGPTIEGGDLEYDRDGNAPPKKITQHWRAYPTLAAAAEDWVGLMRSRFARAWTQLRLGNAAEFAREAREARYFTAPLSEYAPALASCLHRVRAIRRGPDFLPELARRGAA
jgi:flagellum-specific peptidoglycan hydrolase FlgJ